MPGPYISPQETPTAPGFEFPYYTSQDPTIPQPVSGPSQNQFYPPTTTPAYMPSNTEVIPMQQQYPFNPVIPTMQSQVAYVGDQRAMLQGRAVSLGALRPQQHHPVITPQEEDKRRRAASASARFRRRKKEQEEENLKEIARLEKRIEDLKKEYFHLTLILI